jgi:hypothetical protein
MACIVGAGSQTTVIRLTLAGYEGDTYFAQGFAVDEPLAAFALMVLSELLIRRAGTDASLAAVREALQP